VNGGTFDNNGSSSMDAFGTVTIDANVIGNGSFAVAFEYTIDPAGTLEFVKSVGAGESITLDSGIVQVDQPKTFDAR
jgi:hypothetical protein